jgi:hypothetical protein
MEAGWKDDKMSYIPFSYGPYSCIGRNLARQEVRLLVASVIHRFDFQLAADFDPQAFEHQITGEFLLTRPELPMLLRERTKGACMHHRAGVERSHAVQHDTLRPHLRSACRSRTRLAMLSLVRSMRT